MRAALVGLVWLALAVPAVAFDYFVDNQAGDDRRNGRAPTSEGADAGPVRSITKALRLAGVADRIIIINTGEPYRESITIQGPRNSGTPDYPLRIIGNGSVLDGRVSLVGAAWEHVRDDIFAVQPERMSPQLLFLNGAPAVERKAAGNLLPALGPLEWCALKGTIYFRVEPDHLPEFHSPECCGDTSGITLYNVHDVVISDLVVEGFHIDGVNAHDNVRSVDLVGVTSRHNGRSGFSIGGSSRLRLDGCAASGNGEAQVRTEGYSTTQLIGGAFDAASAPALVKDGGRVLIEPAPPMPR
jgi:hypothetical protein